MTAPETYPVTAEDLDLEPPVKQRRLIIEATTVYEVWVDDYDDRGAEALAKSENDSGVAYELIPPNGGSIDGWINVRPAEPYEGALFEEQFGPWQVCGAFGTCERLQYHAYSIDKTCHEHRVIGCQHRNLPERTFDEAPGSDATSASEVS